MSLKINNYNIKLHKIIKKLKLFWQYPVITEKTFYEQNYKNKHYFGFPWATVIDHRRCVLTKPELYNILKSIKIIKGFTCCQHILFRKLIPIFKDLNIITLYTPHKKIGEDNILGIEIKPCPLYAVNIQDSTVNTIFQNINFSNIERPYLYSFQGAFNANWYLTNIRKKIFKMKHPKNAYIRHIGNWHFDRIVYNPMQNEKGDLNINNLHKKNSVSYNCLLLKSRFMLCPSGSGPNSIRLWESLATGAIPILLSDTLDLPKHNLWEKAILRIPEKDVNNINEILKQITIEEEKERRNNCIKIYNHFKTNYRNIII